MASQNLEILNEAIAKNSFQVNELAIQANVEEIVAEISATCNNANALLSKLKSYKSSFTRGLNNAERVGFHLGIDVQNADANFRQSLLEARKQLERPYRVICTVSDLINGTADADAISAAAEEMKTIEKRHSDFALKFEPLVLSICRTIDTAERNEFLRSLKTDAKILAEDKDAEKTLSVAKDSKPNFILDISKTPYEFETWITLCSNYLLSTGADRKSAKIQQSVVLPLMSVDLYERIQDYITNNTAAIMHLDGGRIRMDKNAENPTIIELLIKEWEDEYPIATRRKLIHELKQDGSSSAANWARNMIKQFRIAKYREMTEDEREVSITTVSLRNETLRTLIIEEIKKEQIHNMHELLEFIKLKESSCKESKEPTNCDHSAVYLTNYQRQKRGKLASKDQQRLPANRGRSSSRDRRGKDRYCTFHKVNTHWTADCRAMKGSRKPRTPTPGARGLRARSKSPKAQQSFVIHHKVKDSKPGKILLASNQIKRPILAFQCEVKGQYFDLPAYADTGSSTSILSLKTSQQMGLEIESSSDEITAANGQLLSIEGKSYLNIRFEQGPFLPMKVIITRDFDLDNETINIICFSMLEKLNILKISHLATKARKLTKLEKPTLTPPTKTDYNLLTSLKYENKIGGNSNTKPQLRLLSGKDFEKMSYSALKEYLLESFQDIIRDDLTEEAMKCEPYRIHLNPEKVKKFPPQPVVHVPPYPLHMEKQCKEALRTLEKQHCIAELSEYESSPYLCTSLFVQKKSGSLRIVTNHDSLNCNIDRLNYPIQSPQTLLQRIPPNAQHYLIVDLLKSYYNIPLAKESQVLTSFLTPERRYKWLRCPMGLALSGDVFNLRTDQAFSSHNLELLKCVDDCAIWGSCKQELMEKALKFFSVCKEFNIICSKAKLQLSNEVEYLGNILKGPTISMAPSKIDAVLSSPLPTSTREVRSWCGLAGIFSKHTPDLAIILRPMQKLLQKGHRIVITPEFKKSFELSKQQIASAPILSAFDSKKATILTTDSSKDCLGYALLQSPRDQPEKYYLIKCGSKAMNKHQVNYSMSDKELEGLRWSLMECSYFLRGLKHFVCYNDHKALEQILKKPLDKIQTAHQLRAVLDIRLFSFKFVYKKGSSTIMILADLLSRNPLYGNHGESSENNSSIESFQTRSISLITFQGGWPCSEDSRYFVLATGDTVTKSLLQQLADETAIDQQCQILTKGIQNHTKWQDLENKDLVHGFKQVYDDITIDEMGLLLVDSRIICPKKMISHVCSRLHIGHPGQTRALSLAKSLYFWPSIRLDVLRTCLECQACQTFMRSNPKQEVSVEFSDETSVFPMSHISSDILEVERIKYLVNRDRYSGYIWALKTNSISSESIIKLLDSIFMSFGYPTHFCSDNALGYVSQCFKNWAAHHDIQLITGSPFKSSSQGLVEEANRVVRALLNKSKNDVEFRVNLFAFNCTPRSDNTKYSPAELLFGRRVKSHLPCIPRQLVGDTNQKIYADRIAKKARKYQKQGGAKLPDFSIGDKVRLQNTISRKWDQVGTITKQITVDDIPSKSYLVELPDGTVFRRNKKYIRLMNKADYEKNFSHDLNTESSNSRGTSADKQVSNFQEAEKSTNLNQVRRSERIRKQKVTLNLTPTHI